MAVHFKFRSAVQFDSINFDGPCISIANLKEKIVEQKSLGKGTDFDLLITNAETGEEYTDDDILVPKNTSVIIKRVPATCTKATLLVHDPSVADDLEERSGTDSKNVDTALPAQATPMDDLYDMDDFGVDLYAIDESASTNVDADGTSNSNNLATTKMALDPNRLQETSMSARVYGQGMYGRGFVRGRGYSRGFPPPGYICHRCGQPGHFIQRCSTNGDPAYDMKRVKPTVSLPKTRLKVHQEGSNILPDGSVAFTQPDETAKEAGALLSIKPAQLELPSELRCSLCQKIFKEAVMIPCCNYSFCDNCIRQALIEKEECPQCGSRKCKNDDLLPNVALRQAIDRFGDAQLNTTTAEDDANVESAIIAKVSPASLGAKIKLQNPSKVNKGSSATSMIDNRPDIPFVADSAGKKKKKRTRPWPADGVVEHIAAGKPRKMDRFCYVCGSPDHLARECDGNVLENRAPYPPQRGMFRPVGRIPPGNMTPYGQEMYWHGPVIPQVRPFPLGYREGMYGACTVAVPFDGPVIPIGPCGVGPYMPPIYPNPSMHGGLMGGIGPRMMVPVDRPLSREEFMELQERERRRSLIQERQSREHSEDNPYSRDGDVKSVSLDFECKPHEGRMSAGEYLGLPQKRDLDQQSVRKFSDETDHTKSKSKHSRRHRSEKLAESAAQRQADNVSHDDTAFEDSKGHRSHSEKRQRNVKTISSETKQISKFILQGSGERESSEVEDGQHGYSVRTRERASRDEEHVRSSKLSGSSRYDTANLEKYECSSKKYEEFGTVHDELGSGRHLGHYKSKMPTSEGSKYVSRHERRSTRHSEQYDEGAALNSSHGDIEYDSENKKNDVKHTKRKHWGHTKCKSDTDIIDHAFGDEEKKKKKRHRKHYPEGMKDDLASVYLEEEIVNYKKHKSGLTMESSGKSKSRSSQLEISYAEDSAEEGRWQMEFGLDGYYEETSPHRDPSRPRHQISRGV